MDQIAAELGDRAFVTKYNVDNHRAMARNYGVRGIPAILVLKDGRVVTRIPARSKSQIKAAFESYL